MLTEFRVVSLHFFEFFHGKSILDAAFGHDTREFHEARPSSGIRPREKERTMLLPHAGRPQ